MTRSPKMTGTRSRRNCGREPDIALASDTNPGRSVPSSLSRFLQPSCLPANMPTCQHTLHSINSGPTPRLCNDAEIKSIPSLLLPSSSLYRDSFFFILFFFFRSIIPNIKHFSLNIDSKAII